MLLFGFIGCAICCVSNKSEGHWIVDHYYSKASENAPVQPVYLAACHFDRDDYLQKFIVHDFSWSEREIGYLFFRDGLLIRMVVEDDRQNLLFEMTVEYDAQNEVHEVRDPEERFSRGSQVGSEQMILELVALYQDRPSTDQLMEYFRRGSRDKRFDRKTDRIPQHNIAEARLDSMSLNFGGDAARSVYDFRINTRDYKSNYYERILTFEIENAPPDASAKMDRALLAEEIHDLIAEDEVLSSFNVYKVVLGNGEVIDAGGFGLIEKPKSNITFSAEEIFK